MLLYNQEHYFHLLGKAILRNNLKGFEFAAGIPGTLGGAIAMNAGAYGGEMKDIVKSVRFMDSKEIYLNLLMNKCSFLIEEVYFQERIYSTYLH